MNPYQMKKEDVLKMLGTDENGLTQKTNLRRVKRKIRLYCFWNSTRIFLL